MSPLIPLQIQNLSIGYSKPISQNLNLDIAPKEFVTLMGQNGCGKTTLVDCLLGLTSPLDGSITFWNETHSGSTRAKLNQRIGWVISQKENYPLGLSVDKFLSFVSEQYPSWNWPLCNRLSTEFELDRNKKLTHLSMGEASKVRLIKALSFEPQLIILDELTANLSPSSKEIVLATLLDLFASSELSVLYVSHSNDEALKLSDRIYEMTPSGFQLSGGQSA